MGDSDPSYTVIWRHFDKVGEANDLAPVRGVDHVLLGPAALLKCCIQEATVKDETMLGNEIRPAGSGFNMQTASRMAPMDAILDCR